MSDTFSRAPFVKLLIPVILAIIVFTYSTNSSYCIPIAIIGVILMSVSLFANEENQYFIRWCFGLGLYSIIFSITTFSIQYRTDRYKFDLEQTSHIYIGTIVDIPQEKSKTIAYNVNLSYPSNKNIVAYIQKNNDAYRLQPGDEIVFHSKIVPFNNFGNPDDFDFKKYMNHKGFTGSTYITNKSWQKTGYTNNNLQTHSLHVRQKILELYKSIGLNHDAYSFISALTLGYKDELNNDIKESFRASGTSHVLAVSGLHVGIIYAVFVFLLSFLRKNRKRIIAQQIIIVIMLWCYAFITGLSPSVIRAVIMLSIVSLGRIFNQKVFTYNAVAAAAFLILIFNPLQFFNVGFQMSFAAVVSIIYLNPIFNKFFNIKNKIIRYFYNVSTVSLSAQLGVFPIALYYFATFPTYFFIANLLIVPMIGLIVYMSLATSALIILSSVMRSEFIVIIFNIFKTVLSGLIGIALKIVSYIEALPYSQIKGLDISMLQVLIIIGAIYLGAMFIKKRSPKIIIMSLTLTLLLAVSIVYPKISNSQNNLVIFNTPNQKDISFLAGNKKVHLDIPTNGYIPHNDKIILTLSENRLHGFKAKNKIKVDILILSHDNTFSIPQLIEVFIFKELIIDSSTRQNVREKWIEECNLLNIKVHDVSKEGAYIIKL